MKGMWSSGVTPFGYDKIEKKLFPNNGQAEQVREIFKLYIELESVNKLRKLLRDRGITSQNGREWGDGNLYNILRRKLYIGKIEHKSRTLACRTAQATYLAMELHSGTLHRRGGA